MLREALLWAAPFAFVLLLLLMLACAVIRSLYFSPRGLHPHRRMPRWLIVCVLVGFLVLPQIDVVYALSRLGKKAEQVA